MPENLPCKIAIPEHRAKDAKVCSNLIRQTVVRGGTYEATAVEQSGNVIILKDDSERRIAVALNRSIRGIDADVPVLVPKLVIGVQDLNAGTDLVWRRPPVVHALSAHEIVASWEGKFRFVQEDEDRDIVGLREPQVGAIHAVLAHLAVETSPATVVMPTGTGKTETMLSLLAYKRFRRVLVLVPSDALRTQIGEKFLSFGYLPELGLLPWDVATPAVCMVTKSLSVAAQFDTLIEKSNVFVATPSILNSSDPALVDRLCSECDILFVDESHHIAATTWKAVKDRFVGHSKAVIQFTATPFRNDGGNLEGKIIFNYPLSRAQQNGYFRPIRFFPVSEYLERRKDEAIAEKALEILRGDLDARPDHIMMARVNGTDRAGAIAGIYRRLQREWQPQVIHSGMTKQEKDDALAKLRSRESRIVICVNMLGEGFDFPNLKVAAIHDAHKTLAITLQFVGRFTRKARNIGDAAFVANIAETTVEGNLQALYAQSPDWDLIIRKESERQIEREVRNQELIEGFRDQGDLKKILSLWNLRPAYSTMVFRTPEEAQWRHDVIDHVLPKGSKPKTSHNPAKKILVCVAERNEEVTWGKYKGIENHDLEFLVAMYVPESRALFIHASDYDFYRVEKLAELLVPGARPVAGEPVFRVFSGVERPMVRNLGARKTGDISFTMYFGPNVLDVMTAVEMGGSELSNLAGWGYEAGERCTWGCSQRKGKVWSMGGGDILSWIEWTEKVWRKISNNELQTNDILRSFLCARPIEGDRPASAPISVQWGDSTSAVAEEKVIVTIGQGEFRLSEVELRVDSFEETGPILFSVTAERAEANYRLSYSPREEGGVDFTYEQLSTDSASLKFGSRHAIDFVDHAKRDPLVVTYANGERTVNGYLIQNPSDVGEYRRDRIAALDWAAAGVNIQTEIQGPQRDPSSIQNRIALECIRDYDVVFDDHGSGEAADLVCLRRDEESSSIEVLFVHCKKSGQPSAGARVGDLYELCGQAQKSIRWKHNGFPNLASHLKHREEKAHARGETRFMKGGLPDLALFKEVSHKSKFKLDVWIVQPGVSRTEVSTQMLLLLGATEDYLAKTSNADLTLFGSTS